MFEEISIWKRGTSGEVIRFTCLRNLANNQYAVHSSDFFRLDDCLEGWKFHQRNFIELMAESDPLERCDWHENLQMAIDQHMKDFA